MKGKFDTVITAKKSPFKLNIKEVVKYKDLTWLFVQRDFKTRYKQTILGPLWFIIQPLLTTFVFTIVFGYIAKLSTEGVPQFLFYLSGNVPWLFFAACLNRTSRTFYDNARLFLLEKFLKAMHLLSLPCLSLLYTHTHTHACTPICNFRGGRIHFSKFSPC